MVQTGAISEAQAAEARAHPAIITDRTAVDARNFYLDTAADEAQRLALASGQTLSGDLMVHTTLEPRLQEAARQAAKKVILGKQGKKAHASEAAIVVMKPDGAVSAMIGGVDYTESTFNRATQAHRQPGSAFKPFVYMAALEAGLTPWDVRDDAPVDINGWTPTNYGGRVLRHADPDRRAGPFRQHRHRQSRPGSRCWTRWSMRRGAAASPPSSTPTPPSRSAPAK